MNEKIKELKKELEDLNKSEVIKIDGTDKTRRIFKSKDTFKLFGEMNAGCLNPYDDYTYEWLNSFLYNVVGLIDYTDSDTLEELYNEIEDIISEWADSETDIYTYDLTKWLNDRNYNVELLQEAIKENPDANNHIQIAQYRAIEEVFNSALNIMRKEWSD